jgi:hypothetical protein
MPALETPNPKQQTPNEFQPPISNRLNLRSEAFTPLHHRLPIGESCANSPHPRHTVGLRVLNLNVCWCLEFGFWCSQNVSREFGEGLLG